MTTYFFGMETMKSVVRIQHGVAEVLPARMLKTADGALVLTVDDAEHKDEPHDCGLPEALRFRQAVAPETPEQPTQSELPLPEPNGPRRHGLGKAGKRYPVTDEQLAQVREYHHEHGTTAVCKWLDLSAASVSRLVSGKALLLGKYAIDQIDAAAMKEASLC